MKKWVPSLILLPVVVLVIMNQGKFIPLLDHFNLLIHEGGHGIFSIFPKFLYTLGGTLMQIILPLVFVYYFVSNQKKLGAQISLIWMGQNLLNISVYAGDALERKLPLLGGNKVYHDWTYLLREIDMLQNAKEVGYFFFGLGIIIFVISLLIPLFWKEYKQIKINLKL
ncbi:MAG: hypothetical protein PVH88_12995 [Ignavibacteria bacterium]|jgi:hypothetical protein